MTTKTHFTTRKDFGIAKVFHDGQVAASFTNDDPGRIAFALFIECAGRNGFTVYDMDNNVYLAGSVDQLAGATLSQLFGVPANTPNRAITEDEFSRMREHFSAPISVTDEGDILHTHKKDRVGYISQDGWVVDGTGDRDREVLRLKSAQV
jgi:hypothetical protein